MKWIPWTRRGARESPDAFTPIVAAGEASPRPRSPERSIPKMSAAEPPSVRRASWQSANATSEYSTASGASQGRSRLPWLGAFRLWGTSSSPTARTWRSASTQTEASVSPTARTWRSASTQTEASVHPQPEPRRTACASDRSHSSKAAGPSASSGLPWQAAGRSRSTQPFSRSFTAPLMTMDQFFDTVVAEMQNDEAMLKKSGSEKHGGLIMPSSSAPRGRVTTSFTERPSNPSASTREPGDSERRMTKAQILARKTKNRVFPSLSESEEGIDTSARPPPLPAKRLETVAPGDPSNVTAECAFWSLEPNTGSLFGTNSD